MSIYRKKTKKRSKKPTKSKKEPEEDDDDWEDYDDIDFDLLRNAYENSQSSACRDAVEHVLIASEDGGDMEDIDFDLLRRALKSKGSRAQGALPKGFEGFGFQDTGGASRANKAIVQISRKLKTNVRYRDASTFLKKSGLSGIDNAWGGEYRRIFIWPSAWGFESSAASNAEARRYGMRMRKLLKKNPGFNEPLMHSWPVYIFWGQNQVTKLPGKGK